MANVANPYGNQDLFIAKNVSERLGEFVSRSDRETKPFARQVDAWWLAIGIGAKMGRRTALPSDTVKFNDGGILSSDPWRITHLEALALAEEGADVINNPAQVIRIATEYANTGFQWLIDEMLGEAEPTLTVINSISEFLSA